MKTPGGVTGETTYVDVLSNDDDDDDDDDDSDSEDDVEKQETAPFKMLSCAR